MPYACAWWKEIDAKDFKAHYAGVKTNKTLKSGVARNHITSLVSGTATGRATANCHLPWKWPTKMEFEPLTFEVTDASSIWPPTIKWFHFFNSSDIPPWTLNFHASRRHYFRDASTVKAALLLIFKYQGKSSFNVFTLFSVNHSIEIPIQKGPKCSECYCGYTI